MITTITLNPALDRLLSTGEIEMGEANRVERKFDFPAGKGVDVAKVLSDMGREVSATGFLGGHAAGAFEACSPGRASAMPLFPSPVRPV